MNRDEKRDMDRDLNRDVKRDLDQDVIRMESSSPLLKIENGSFSYRGGPQILREINIEARPGEILAVLGPNGAGKTTLLRCMMDMLHWNSGRSLLGGEDIRSIPASKLWRRMAYVPQAKSAATSFTAFQTVLLGRSSHINAFSSPSDEDMQIAERVMKDLGIWELADKACHAISGGELQMVLIARAMAAEPEILVLDEPESNLDFRNQLIVLDAMSGLAAAGTACIFNTHYPAHALQRADKSLLLFRTDRGNASGGTYAGPRIKPGSKKLTDPGKSCNGSQDETGRGRRSEAKTDTYSSIFGSTLNVVTEDNIRRAFGVNAVIGEFETESNILRNVMPLSLFDDIGAAGPYANADSDPGRSEGCLSGKHGQESYGSDNYRSAESGPGLCGSDDYGSEECGTGSYGSDNYRYAESGIEPYSSDNYRYAENRTGSYGSNYYRSGKIVAGSCESEVKGAVLASITVISDSNEAAGRINSLLREFSHLIVGRMGQPYRKYGLYIINVTLDGSMSEIRELSHRLGIIPGISVKTTYAALK